jgi:hypothetical protein
LEQYSKTEWLSGCRNIGKLFCWPCLLFLNKKNVWNKSGPLLPLPKIVLHATAFVVAKIYRSWYSEVTGLLNPGIQRSRNQRLPPSEPLPTQQSLMVYGLHFSFIRKCLIRHLVLTCMLLILCLSFNMCWSDIAGLYITFISSVALIVSSSCR